MKNTLLRTFGAALALAMSATAVAQPATQRPDTERNDRDRDGRRDRDDRGPARPAPAKKPVIHKDRYGSWDSSWGARPGAAPAHWTRKGDWYRHVRACQKKFRSYSAKSDTYLARGGKRVRCKL